MFKRALPLLAILSISACQPGFVLKPEPEPEPVVVEPEQEAEPQPQPPPDDMPASRRVKKSLQLLAQGEYENARNQLTWALQDKPGLQMAENLIEQIDADPIDYLGIKNFYYQVKSGDSLSIIAGKFLDDPMKFVILARYNQLDNPSKLAPGDRIRVPGAMPEQEWKKTAKKPRRVKPPSAAMASTTVPPIIEDDEQTETPTQPSGGDNLPSEAGSQLSLEQELDIARQLHAKGDLPAAIYHLESE
ncbi:MAG: LysM domain-containing protein, partial [Candidatus Thiodiazotropha sp.]